MTPESTPEASTGLKTGIVEPSINDMQAEIEGIEKQIAVLEKSRDKVVSEKHRLLTSDGDYHSIEACHKKEKAIESELAELSKKHVTKKQALSWCLADKENQALALGAVARYDEKKNERLEAGLAVANDIKSLIAAVGQLSISAKGFTPLQNRAYTDALRMTKDFKQWGISNLNDVSIEQIRNDTTLEMRKFKESVRSDIMQLNNCLHLLQSVLWDVSHAIDFVNYQSVEKPPELPSY